MKKKKTTQPKIDDKILKQSVDYAKKQPRLAFYSPTAAAVLNYRKNVIPRYSISDELADIVERALKERYPSLVNKAKKMMKSGNRISRQASSKQAEPTQAEAESSE